MATQAVDFTKINSRGYKVWRILQAAGAWAQVYRDREQVLRNYKSAIIFPEQLLGLNQKCIYTSQAYRTGQMVTGHVRSHANFAAQSEMSESFATAEQIYEYERLHSSEGDLHRLRYGQSNADQLIFHNSYLFSSLKDAVKHQQKRMEALTSQLG